MVPRRGGHPRTALISDPPLRARPEISRVLQFHKLPITDEVKIRMLFRLCLVLMATLMTLPAASAQEGFAPPPQIPYGLSINIDDAKTVADAAIARAEADGW